MKLFKNIKKCEVENCQIIYTEDQCKNCPNQVFTNTCISTTYFDQSRIKWYLDNYKDIKNGNIQ